jgi:hypothetical protein
MKNDPRSVENGDESLRSLVREHPRHSVTNCIVGRSLIFAQSERPARIELALDRTLHRSRAERRGISRQKRIRG